MTLGARLYYLWAEGFKYRFPAGKIIPYHLLPAPQEREIWEKIAEDFAKELSGTLDGRGRRLAGSGFVDVVHRENRRRPK